MKLREIIRVELGRAATDEGAFQQLTGRLGCLVVGALILGCVVEVAVKLVIDLLF